MHRHCHFSHHLRGIDSTSIYVMSTSSLLSSATPSSSPSCPENSSSDSVTNPFAEEEVLPRRSARKRKIAGSDAPKIEKQKSNGRNQSKSKYFLEKDSSIANEDLMQSTEEITIPTTENSNNSNVELLEEWIQHSHHSYHLDTFLSPDQAYKIRVALVKWYRANRRKLPWRGDEGPYDGSTAGYGTASSSSSAAAASNKKRKASSKSAAAEANPENDIRSFFTASSTKEKKQTAKKSKTASLRDEEEKKEEEETNENSSSDAATTATTTSNHNTTKREVTAYGVWVSEIMLQQTRVEAVIPYYLKWMQSFPTVHALANATPEEVNSHWAGLGFYRRARLLHTGAQRVVNEYDGIVPNTVEELMKVEGIGRYTASAVGSIAYGVEVPVVDGNVCRVFSRLTGVANHIKAGVLKDDLGWALAKRIVQAKDCGDGAIVGESNDELGSPGEVNQALMELGATYCSPTGSGSEEGDPLRDFYASTKIGVEIGRAVCFGDGSTKRHIETLIAGERKSQCRLCDQNGISSVFYDVTDRITTGLITSSTQPKREVVAAIAGHASFPLPPPKKAKREEVIAVAVITLQQSKKEEDRWLMVKRPSEGLLAGQWEFPSVCVWNSAWDKESKGKEKENFTTETKVKKTKASSSDIDVPIIDGEVRSMALDSFLSGLLQTKHTFGGRKRVGNDPVEHIFSHVRHTMWIEHGNCKDNKPLGTSMRWKSDDKEVGWLSESDMKTVGITSGVRKVLAVVQKQGSK